MKARSPAAVKTATRTSRSSANPEKTSMISANVPVSTALTGGRSSVTVAMWSTTSTRRSPMGRSYEALCGESSHWQGGQMSIQSIAGIIRTHGRRKPDAPAIHYEGRDITFGELDTRSNQLANALAAAGISEGDRVAFLDKNGPEYFETTFALSKLNAVNVAVNWRLASTEMAQVINDATAKALIVGQDFVPHIEKVEDDIPTVATIVAIGGHARWLDYEEFLGAGDSTDPGNEGAG